MRASAHERAGAVGGGGRSTDARLLIAKGGAVVRSEARHDGLLLPPLGDQRDGKVEINRVVVVHFNHIGQHLSVRAFIDIYHGVTLLVRAKRCGDDGRFRRRVARRGNGGGMRRDRRNERRRRFDAGSFKVQMYEGKQAKV